MFFTCVIKMKTLFAWLSAWPDGEGRAFLGGQTGSVSERYFDLEILFNKLSLNLSNVLGT